VTEADLLTLERPFISAFFSPKPRATYTSLSSSTCQQEDDDEEEDEEEGSSKWSDSDEDDDATTDFTSSPSGSDRSVSPKTPSNELGSFPLPPPSDTASLAIKVVPPQPKRYSCPQTRPQIPLPLSV
jgi:hypothetical protein